MNCSGSGSPSQTCGRKVARFSPSPCSRMIPSTPGRSCAMRSAWSSNSSRFGAESSARKFFARERLEARVLERRGAGVLGDVIGEGPLRFERADAAAQLFAQLERDEARAPFLQPGLVDVLHAG